MKKRTKMSFITLLMTAFFLTVIPIPMPVKAEEIPIFTVGTSGPQSVIRHWSMEAYDASYGDYYLYNAIEPLYQWPYEAENGSLENLVPVLATNWTTHERPEEMTAAGFMAYEGIDYIDITLRENVTFHDGSDWNATVCKWNIDRTFYILGDLGDCISSYDSAVTQTRPIYWLKIDDWDDYATTSWNVTKLTPGVYGQPGEYPRSGDAFYNGTSGSFYSRFPRFNNVTILDDKKSGGTVRVYFNDWGSGPNYLANFEFISMHAYENYFDVQILGYGNNPSFPQDNPSIFPGHLIGTGPYIFEGHDDSTGSGTMRRNDNWWNASAQQAEGWDMVPRVAVQAFPHNLVGYQGRTNALITGDINYATDREWEPIEYSTVAAVPNQVKYVPMGVEPYGETIVLNCIDETYLKYWSDIGYNVFNYYIPGGYGNSTLGSIAATIDANGINRAFRKALSYALDYNTYITVSKADRVVRSGGLLGVTNEYYDPTTPLAYLNLTIARETLLNDTFWGPICNAHGLFDVNDNWVGESSSDPIYTMEYHYDLAHEDSYFALIDALENIGCAIDATEDLPNTYGAMFGPLAGSGSYPIFSNDGFAISPYHARFNDLGYIQAYLQSPGVVQRSPYNSSGYPVISDYKYINPGSPYPHYLSIPFTTWPYVATPNLGFNYNKTCDDLIYKLWFQNATGEQELYKELATWIQDFQYPVIYLSNQKTGYAVTTEWDVKWASAFFTFSFNYVKYLGAAIPPAIPGYEMGIVLSIMLISFVGIIYTIMRNKKTNK